MESVDNILVRYKRYLLLERAYSPNTIDAYLADIGKLVDFFSVEGVDVLAATLDDVRYFAESLSDVGVHPRSQARILSGVRNFYRFLLLDGYVESDPCELLETPRLGRHIPDILTLDEIDLMVRAAENSENDARRNKAILEVLYGCGLRVSELVNLKFSDVYADEQFLRITGKGDKQRLVPISQRALDAIGDYMPERESARVRPGEEDYVFISRFGKRMSRITVFHFIKLLADGVGITKNISPHTFRHSFATHMVERGANLRAVQCMLGHETIKTTEIYTHLDTSTLRYEILEHHPRNRRGTEENEDS